MPVLKFGRAVRLNQNLKAFFEVEVSATRGATSDDTLRGIRDRLTATAGKREKKLRDQLARKERKISRLEARLSARTGSHEPEAPIPVGDANARAYGALPDFIIIGAQKSGTTYLFHLLSRHPYVLPATTKEVHYFDTNFDEGSNWYRSHFPFPEQKDGRKTVTGEASPHYLSHPLAAERTAGTIPGVKLIVLLRNPVNRAYSHYQARVRREGERLGFAEAIEADWKVLQEGYTSRRSSYLGRGIYVDQLRRWHEFFGRDQILILKSEDFFARTTETLNRTLSFLELPNWQPKPSSTRQRIKDRYEPMPPETRRWLEEFFEPHNQRLYEYLDVDFGW